jgi:hypothetical protein
VPKAQESPSTSAAKGDLLEEILAVQAENRHQACSVKRLLEEELTPEEAGAIRTVLANPSVAGTVIAQVLKGRGHKMSGHTIQRHRANRCSCNG